MKKASLILIAALCLASRLAVAQAEHVASGKSSLLARQLNTPTGYYGPTALGPFSIDNKEGGVEFSKLSSSLGQLVASIGQYACYRNAENIQLVVERGTDSVRLVRGVTLSQIGVCPIKRIAQASGFSGWATEKGIRLGSTVNEVLSKYGKPSSVRDGTTGEGFSPYPREGDHSRMTNEESTIVYLPTEGAADTSHAFFGIRNGVVVWMTVSDNE